MSTDDRFDIEDVGPAKRSWRERTRHPGSAVFWVLMGVGIISMLVIYLWCNEITARIEEERRAAQVQAETVRVQAVLKTLGCEVWSPALDEFGARHACGMFHGQPFEVVRRGGRWFQAMRVIERETKRTRVIRYEPGNLCEPELSRFLDAWCDFPSDTEEAKNEH